MKKIKILKKKIFWTPAGIFFWTPGEVYCLRTKGASELIWLRHHGSFIVIRYRTVKEKYLKFHSHGFKYFLLLDDSFSYCERKILNILDDVCINNIPMTRCHICVTCCFLFIFVLYQTCQQHMTACDVVVRWWVIILAFDPTFLWYESLFIFGSSSFWWLECALLYLLIPFYRVGYWELQIGNIMRHYGLKWVSVF